MTQLSVQLQHLANKADIRVLQTILANEYNAFTNKLFVSPALAIKTGGSALVKTGAATYGFANGVLFTVAINTDMPALVGSVANATFNVFVFLRNSKTGTVTSAIGVPAATLAGVKFPPYPLGFVALGFIIVNPTGTGPFIGGTTALDDATVVPNVVYLSSPGSLDQTNIV